MSKELHTHLIKSGGRLAFSTCYERASRLREVRVKTDMPLDLILEKVQIGKECALLGSMVVGCLPIDARGYRSFHVSSGAAANSRMTFWFRSISSSSKPQKVNAEIRLQTTDGMDVVLTLEK